MPLAAAPTTVMTVSMLPLNPKGPIPDLRCHPACYPVAHPRQGVRQDPSCPPVIKSFTEMKRDKEIRRGKLRAQTKKARAKFRAANKPSARKPSAHERRRMERKTRSFLISTIDDAHVLLVEGRTSAFAIYQKLRDRYEGSTNHGDRYCINHNDHINHINHMM
ncbi:hypothetical protein PI124_g16593 [Phytophthora idaei]|nr:hypothetical protein PI125_g16872 [Phytophthora idaei]KAG3140822.1 hypothetical protein PI126_g15803 [Phytophthora idaei]KAG3238446.1 hypothetical protein PI124_g16593 [Phytophthora idaei]